MPIQKPSSPGLGIEIPILPHPDRRGVARLRYAGSVLLRSSSTMQTFVGGDKGLAMARKDWTPEQVKLAFHLYCQLPFGRLHRGNPEVISLANLIERSPSAVAMKLVNFASLDPVITASGRKGLSGASKLDQAIWDQFHADWEGLVLEVNRIRHTLGDPAEIGRAHV